MKGEQMKNLSCIIGKHEWIPIEYMSTITIRCKNCNKLYGTFQRQIKFKPTPKPKKQTPTCQILYNCVLNETPLAWLVVIGGGKKFWAAKSQCSLKGNKVTMPKWLKEKIPELKDISPVPVDEKGEE